MEWKGTQGMRWGFSRKFSVKPDFGEVGGGIGPNIGVSRQTYVKLGLDLLTLATLGLRLLNLPV